jgi:hypothetical protein
MQRAVAVGSGGGRQQQQHTECGEVRGMDELGGTEAWGVNPLEGKGCRNN